MLSAGGKLQQGSKLYESPTDPLIAQVLVLMHMDGANNSTTFTDEKGRAVTRVGTPVISTAWPAGGSSALFNGTTDYLTLAASASFAFAGDFCIELTYNPSNIAGNKCIIGNAGPTDGAGLWMLRQQGAGIVWYTSGFGIWAANAAIFTAGVPVKFRMERVGSIGTLYANGKIVGGSNNANAISGTYGLSSTLLSIGARTSGGDPTAGYVDEVRITANSRDKGEYTPRISPFPNA